MGSQLTRPGFETHFLLVTMERVLNFSEPLCSRLGSEDHSGHLQGLLQGLRDKSHLPGKPCLVLD
jgi:hypothetical protein